MNTTILDILCEGQTEELFVKTVLKPFLSSLGLVVKPRLLVTSKKKSAKGGIIVIVQAKGDLSKWIDEVSQKKNETHYFTTMFDWYALPTDFPGYQDASRIQDVYLQVEKIENEFSKDIKYSRFIPYIQLHEFEALLFCDIEKLEKDYPSSGSSVTASIGLDMLRNKCMHFNSWLEKIEAIH